MLAMHQATATLTGDEERQNALATAHETIDALLQQGACCSVRDLAIGGADLLALGCAPGKTMGLCLQRAFSAVLDGGVENEKNALLAYCKQHLL